MSGKRKGFGDLPDLPDLRDSGNNLVKACADCDFEIVENLLLTESREKVLNHGTFPGNKKPPLIGMPLRFAIKCKDGEKFVKLLLDKGADPSVNNNEFLIKACNDGQEEIVRLLLDTGDVDPTQTHGVIRNAPLFNASMRNHEEIVKMLLDTGIHFDLDDLETYKELHIDEGIKTLINEYIIKNKIAQVLNERHLSKRIDKETGKLAHVIGSFFNSKLRKSKQKTKKSPLKSRK